MSGKIEEQKTCHLCTRPLSDYVELGKFQVHPQCMARFWDIARVIFHFTEKAVAPHDGPKAPEDREWDADAAEQRVRRWASSDGSGDKEKVDWDRYRQAFAWYNSEDPENFGSYKLPHHDVVDGRLCVVWRGVAAAMAALMGARGGVDIPAGDRRSVYTHLARHYAQFDREPPPLEALTMPSLVETVEQQKAAISRLISENEELKRKLKTTKQIILKL